MRKISALLIAFLLLFFQVITPTFAHNEIEFPSASDGQVQEALNKIVPLRFIPSSPFYFSITVKETVARIFKPSSAKRTEFDMVLAGKRLKESYLLVGNGDMKNASKNLTRYAKRVEKVIGGLEKTRSQNQDVVSLVSEIAEDMKSHEVLFFAIGAKAKDLKNEDNFEDNFNGAAVAFLEAIAAINEVRPGIGNRFKSASSSAGTTDLDDDALGPPSYIEATDAIKPKKIIY